MTTEFDNALHWGFFLTGTKLTSETGKYVRVSDLVLAALRAAGVFSNMVDGVAAPAIDKLWLDKNFDPAVLKEWDATGASWVPMTYGRLFGRAAVDKLVVTGGTGNAVVVSQPAGFQADRLYLITPTANNTAATAITVSGVGTYAVRYGDGADIDADEFATGRQAVLFFTGSRFEVVFPVGDLNTAVVAAEAARDKAREWAANPVDVPVESDPPEFSAKHSAIKAAETLQEIEDVVADALEDMQEIYDDLVTQGVRIGQSIMWNSLTAPDGYLKENGAAISRTVYHELFDAIGTTFGAGDGSTTFNLPDSRAEFIRGLDDGRGVDAGRALGSAQGDTLQNATGSLTHVIMGGSIAAGGAFNLTSRGNENLNAGGGQRFGADITFDLSRVARTSTETRPRNVAKLFLIRAY